jgi:stress-induced morphogen|tara:strand:+ start:255 stop:425 length:171 start_codon:yes stop_codon:yes gene_type:complete
MYKIFVVSPEFEGLALVKQHRLVQKAIAGEIADMHGLTLKTQTAKKYKASTTAANQ